MPPCRQNKGKGRESDNNEVNQGPSRVTQQPPVSQNAPDANTPTTTNDFINLQIPPNANPSTAEMLRQIYDRMSTLEALLYMQTPPTTVPTTTPATHTPVNRGPPVRPPPSSTARAPTLSTAPLALQVSSSAPTAATAAYVLPPQKIPVKNKGPKPYTGKEGTLQKFLFQMEEFLRPYKTAEEDEKLSVLTLSLEGSVLDWWYEKRVEINTWAEAKQALWDQYGDQFVRANARRDLEALIQTGRIQEYLAEVERLNGHAKLPTDVLMDLITRKVKPQLRNMIAPFTDLMETDPAAWKKKSISCGNSIEQNDRITKANNNGNRYDRNNSNRDNNNQDNNNHNNNRDKNNRDKSYCDKYDHNRNKHQNDHKRKGDENPTTNKRPKTVESVPSQKKSERRNRGDCIKCGLKGHQISNCQVGWRASTLTMREDNKEKTQEKNKDKSKKTDSGTLRITELGSESENE